MMFHGLTVNRIYGVTARRVCADADYRIGGVAVVRFHDITGRRISGLTAMRLNVIPPFRVVAVTALR